MKKLTFVLLFLAGVLVGAAGFWLIQQIITE